MSQRQRKARAKQRRHAPITAARPRAIAIGGAALGATLAMGGVAQADTFTVQNTNPSGEGSLAEAINLANENLGFDTITFNSDVTGEITLEDSLPTIYDDVDIQGPGADKLAVSGNDHYRVFTVGSDICESIVCAITSDGTLVKGAKRSQRIVAPGDYGTTISGLTIKDGSAEYGGAVAANGGPSVLSPLTATGDPSGLGADLTLDGVVIKDSGAEAGGGVFAKYSAVTIKNSTLSGNGALIGGGVFTDGGCTTIDQSTIKDGGAYLGGGLAAVGKYGGFTDVANSTISGNQANLGAGALTITSYNEFANSTIAENVAAPYEPSETVRRASEHANFLSPGYLEYLASYGIGGGIASLNAYSRLDSTTVTGNSAAFGGGVFSTYGYEDINRPGVAKALSGVRGLRRQVRAHARVSGDEKPSWSAPRLGVGAKDVSFGGDAQVFLDNSLLAGNESGTGHDDLLTYNQDIGSAFTLVQSDVNNALFDVVDAGSDIVGEDAHLGSLGDHGGPTQTILPAIGSPAVDHGSDPFSDGSPIVRRAAMRKLLPESPSFDQRGFDRPIGEPAWIVDDGEDGNLADGSDIGAVELQPGEKVPGNPDVSVIVPVITSVAPATGHEGSTVVITGDRFNGATRVYFGNTPATTFSVDGFHQITAIAPAGTGAVDVHVTTPEGTSSSVAADKFTYLDTAGAPSTEPGATPPKLQGLLAALKSVLLSKHNDQLAFIDQFGEPGTAFYGLDLTFNTGNASAVKRIHLASHRVTVDHAGAVRVRIHLSKKARKIMAGHPGAKLSVRSRFVSKATGQVAVTRRTLRHPAHRHHHG